jgi:D-erythronate 2-dehydrogenase
VRVAVTGAAGMIGRKLTDRLVVDGHLGGVGLDRLSLFDVVEPATPEGWTGALDRVVLDLAEPAAGDALVAHRPEVILHLAAVVSGEAEANFDKGYRVNLDGTRHLLEAIRRTHLADGYLPRLVFTSSIAVYGAPLPDPIPDEFPATPRTSYGTQKAIDELLLADFTRRGFVDGVGIRCQPSASVLASQT